MPDVATWTFFKAFVFLEINNNNKGYAMVPTSPFWYHTHNFGPIPTNHV